FAVCGQQFVFLSYETGCPQKAGISGYQVAGAPNVNGRLPFGEFLKSRQQERARGPWMRGTPCLMRVQRCHSGRGCTKTPKITPSQPAHPVARNIATPLPFQRLKSGTTIGFSRFPPVFAAFRL